MKLNGLVIFLICIPFVSFSQMINEMELHNFKVAFSETCIKNNKIKSVTGHTSYKKSLKPIVEKGTYNSYVFNREGKLVSLVETFKLSQANQDSSVTNFLYLSLIHI